MADLIILPVSGKTATFRKLKARDLVEAERQCDDPKSEKEYGLALLSRRVLLDGVQASKPEIEDLDLEDVMLLFGAFDGFSSASQSVPLKFSGSASA